MIRKVLTILWIVATSLGFGLGWYWALSGGGWIVAGLPLAISQGIVILFARKWRLSLAWVVATGVGWILAYVAMALADDALGGVRTSWTTTTGIELGWLFAFLPFIGVPIVAFAQALVLRIWVKSENMLYWFGVSVCSFPVAGFIAIFVHDPRDYLFDTIPPFSPTLWLLGAVWGACTGWALFGISELKDQVPSVKRVGVYRVPVRRSIAP